MEVFQDVAADESIRSRRMADVVLADRAGWRGCFSCTVYTSFTV